MVSRVMPFACQHCRDDLFNLPKIVKRINDLETSLHNQNAESIERVVTLEQRIVAIEQTLSDLSSMSGSVSGQVSAKSAPTTPSDTDILSELHDRQKRINNVMIFNLDLQNGRTETAQVKDLLTDLCGSDVNVVAATRIGKPNRNGHKAIKVVLGSTDEVKLVLKNRMKPTESGKIFIEADMTHRQLSDFEATKLDLKRRRENGENNLCIRYISGSHRVVTKN